MRKLSDFSLRAAIPVGIAAELHPASSRDQSTATLSIFSRGAAIAAITASATLGLLALAAQSAHAAEATDQTVSASSDVTKSNKNDSLDEVVVTGSLIPHVREETSTPITVITAEDIKNKGFASVADALQHSSFATGSVQGGGFSGGFTQGANVVSFFGLSPSYTKILIDGRPIADYPALYNGTDIVPSIQGIPVELVDHIDVLPGGQSSIYGSDAIAGVINVVMKKQMDGPTVDVRGGWDTEGGGTNRRIAIADGFNLDTFHALAGVQYERTDPVWGYQRNITSHYFAGGSSPQTAERDWLNFGYYGPNFDGLNAYYFADPNATPCGNVLSQFGGTTALQTRANRGSYCGTTSSGYYTLANGSENTEAYIHLENDFNDHVQVFSDILVSHDVTRFAVSGGFFGTADDATSPYTYFEDPLITTQDYLNVQQVYSPEETGGVDKYMDKNTINGIRATVGVKGDIVANWTYAVDMTYTENKLTELTHLAFTDEINNFYSSIFGPNLGFDPVLGASIYEPNYAAFYSPITPAQYASFTGYAASYSRTEESLARAQITNAALFPLPGGNAGLALVVDGGGQGWDYQPDPRYLDGETYLYTATAGSGHRSRYSGTGELKLPIVKMLTIDASGRYDDYKVEGNSVDKFTYNIGIEFRPFQQLLLRGRYGTAFKAPTLSDEFQGQSGFFTGGTDYYTCAKEGFDNSTPAKNIGNCPQAGESIGGTTSGTPGLKPITAKVSDIGVAWQPLDRMNATVDFLQWKISNEVAEQDLDQLLRTEAACRLGQLDINSPTCVQAIAQVTRSDTGAIVSVNTPKINVAQETLNVLTFSLNYTLPTDVAGTFIFEGNYTDLLKHTEVMFAGDSTIDLLQSPFYSTEFKTKENLAVTWNYAKFGTTAYVERYGRTPNYLSQQEVDGYATPGAGRVGTWTIANLSAKYEVIPGLVVSGNCENVFNKQPPKDNSFDGLSNQPYNSLNYNPYGRSFFVEANYKFGKY